MCTTPRFVNPGRVTQYEIADVKDLGPSRVWSVVWAGVSDEFHPHSQVEWEEWIEMED